MNDNQPPRPDDTNLDHWEMFAEAMDLTIEGHRLIAEEIVFECKLLGRTILSWLRDLGVARWRASPPA